MDASRSLILVGLPGSGKSTFAKGLAQLASVKGSGPLTTWHRISQDDLGSRSKCENEAKRFAKKSLSRVIIDRCNPTFEERALWISLLPAPTSCVFFDIDKELCLQRILTRHDHPTIKFKIDEHPKARAFKVNRILRRFAEKLRRPKISEGFSRIHVIKCQEDAERLLSQFGVGLEAESTIPSTEDIKVAVNPADDAANPSSTRHFLYSGESAVTRDDLLLECKQFLNSSY